MTTKKVTVPTSTATQAVSTPGASLTPGSLGLQGASTSPTKFQSALQQMLQGFQTGLPTGSTLLVNGTSLEQSAIVAQLQQALALFPPVVSAKQAYAQAVAARAAGLAEAHQLMVSLKEALIVSLGKSSVNLTGFGITVKTRTTPSAVQTAVKVAKARATRVTNGTLGKKQRANAELAKQVQAVSATLVPLGTPVPPQPVKPTTAG